MKYETNKKSLKSHKVPEWFHDAKLGIFIHWGIYSIPAFAQTEYDIIENIKRGGWKEHFKNNPYAEWYLNSLRIEGSPTQKYHEEKYGKEFGYDDFVPEFNKAIEKWNPDEMAETFKKAGARYVVLGTKHHDGFTLWPSKYPNPNKENYHAKRDIVGELTNAVREKGVKMGVYYSGALDWSFNKNPIDGFYAFINNGPLDSKYAEYAENHMRELIDEYQPSILWNDIGHPPAGKPFVIMAEYYNKIKDGVINDRWMQIGKGTRKLLKGPLGNLVSWAAKRAMAKGSTSPIKVPHSDFVTPEYATFKKIKRKKWECTRGIGKSFGYNQFEDEESYLSSDELIRMFIDIVSKNGNLLLNVGPMADGTIPKEQADRILRLGTWLEVNGEAIYKTRPWVRADGLTDEGIEVRFTQKENKIYAILLDKPKKDRVIFKRLILKSGATIQLLGSEEAIKWSHKNKDLEVNLPVVKQDAPAYVFQMSPKPRD